MTFNIIFFSITISKRNYTPMEVMNEISIQKIQEQITDRRCEMHRYL
ncbi:YrzI family small protein [Bacillus salitolerans]|uniref:YrzI family small protein n=1 Tax=Bacillus salitolerans TaxID=1437434 RepID=A0ABW4LRM5_9BACI